MYLVTVGFFCDLRELGQVWGKIHNLTRKESWVTTNLEVTRPESITVAELH